MTEPARSMAASLASLEAHRTDRDEVLKTADLLKSDRHDARSYLDQAPRQLSTLRSAILDAEISWKKKCAELDITWKRTHAELQARYDDDLAKLNGEYAAILTDLTDMARRIQATRE